MPDTGTFFLRTASERDLPALRTLLVETWHDTYDAIYGQARVNEITDVWHSLAALGARLKQPHSEFVLADNGRRIGGMAFAAAENKGQEVKLRQLYVHPECQGIGIGKALFAEIAQCFPEARFITLEVDEANSAARAFYARLGFEQTGRSEDCGEAGFDIPALVYRRML
ncbi:GNAT family N-acetyltransferase [uncultured Nitratireductor sp.]|uniref:GNAT family N-acetyltransferase n=1 Tax=uncultured Nitratireductor sp. TaxID=520953 RepID=UPI0025CE7848|nr:GNAT family N-acetyltransferase [uncultured Nitratireductor sp.]